MGAADLGQWRGRFFPMGRENFCRGEKFFGRGAVDIGKVGAADFYNFTFSPLTGGGGSVI